MSASQPVSTRSALLSRSALCGVAGGVLLAAAHPTAAEDLSGSSTLIGHVSAVQQSGAAPPTATITTAGSTFTITPNATRSIIDWDSFKVDTTQSLTFAFAAGGDIAVNRVATGKAEVLGALASKVGAATGGNVWILAPDGIVFGATSATTVGGLFASTASLKTADAAFLAGSGTETHSFGGAPDGSTITVTAGAQLTATGHSLALIAPVLASGTGSKIEAKSGTALLAAAQSYKVSFASSAGDLDLVSFEVDPATVAQSVTLAGKTTAGDVWIAVSPTSVVGAVISLGDVVTATSAFGQNGDIILSGGGTKVDATGVTGVRDATGATPLTGKAVDVALTAGKLPVADGSFTVETSGGITPAFDYTAAKGLTLVSGTGDLTLGKLKTVAGPIDVSAQDLLTIDKVTAAGDLALASETAKVAVTNGFTAGGTVSLVTDSFVNVLAGLLGGGNDVVLKLTTAGLTEIPMDIAAGAHNIDLETRGALTTQDLSGANIIAKSQGALKVSKVTGTGAVALTSGAALTADDVTGKGVTIDAGSISSIGAIDAGSGVAAIKTGTDFSSGKITGAGVSFDVTGKLTIDGANLDAGSGALTLKVSGATTETTALSVKTLTGASGSLDLSLAGTQIEALTNLSTTVGGLKLVTGKDLAVSGGLTAMTTADVDASGHTLTVSGAVDSAGGTVFHADTIKVAADVTTSTGGGLEFDGPVTLTSAGAVGVSSGGQLTFDGAIKGAKALTLSADSVVLKGAVGAGAGNALTSFSSQTTGATTLNNVTTTGGQSYTSAILPTDVVLTSNSGDIKFTGAVDSSDAPAKALTVSTSGQAGFGGAIGGAKGLSTLSVTAGAASFGATNGDVGTLAVKLTAAGDLVYAATKSVKVGDIGAVKGVSTSNGAISLDSTGGALTLAGDVSAAGGAGAVTLKAEGGALTQDAGKVVASTLALTGKGGVKLDSATNAFTSLGPVANTGSGTVVVNDGQGFAVGDTVTNTVAAGSADITLSTSAGDITVTKAISAGGPGVAGTLKILPAGALKVGSDLAAGTDLTLGDVVLTGDAKFTAGHQLTLGKLDGNAKATLNNGTVAGALTGAIGAATPLASLTVNGPATFSGATVKTTGAQTFNGNLTLGADTALTSTGGADIAVTRVDSDATARTLSFVANGGAAVFKGPAGGSGALQSVTTDGVATFGGSVITVGDQTYNGAAKVSADSALKSAGGTIKLASTLDAATSAAPAPSLVIDAGKATGVVIIGGAIGGANPVGLGVRAASFTGMLSGQHLTKLATDLTGGLTVANAQTLTVDKITAGGVTVDGITTQGQDVSLTTTSGDLVLNAALSLNGGKLALDAAGAIKQTAGVITATSVSAEAGTDIGLGGDNATAAVVKLDGDTVTYTSKVAGPTDFQHVTSVTATLTTKGGDLNVGVGGVGGVTVSLSSSADITENGGSVAAGTLSAVANGVVAMGGGAANDVTTLDQLLSNTGQAVSFNDVNKGLVHVNDVGGSGASGSATTLSFAGDADFGGLVNAGGQLFDLTAGKVTGSTATVKAATLTSHTSGGLDFSNAGNAIATLGAVADTAGDIKISTTGTLKSTGDVVDDTGHSLTLKADGFDFGGVIKADTLTGGTTDATNGAAVFSAQNLVGHIGDFAAGKLTFVSGQGIDVSGGLKVAGALKLDAQGAITQGAVGTVAAGSLEVVEATAVDLSRLAAGAPVNAIQAVSAITVAKDGDVALSTTTGLSLAGLISGVGASQAGAVTLMVGGAITRTSAGLIYAKSFGGSSGGAADLSGLNKVEVLDTFTSGGKFDFGDTLALTVNGAVKSDGKASTELYVHGDAGLTLTSTVDAGAGTLRIESKDGAIDADKATLNGASLTGFAAAGASFDNAANTVAVLAGFETNKGGATTDPFVFTTSTGLDVTSKVLTHDGGLTLNAKGGDLSLKADLDAGNTAGAVTLDALGEIEQTAGFIVTAATFSAAATGPVSLLSANQVGDFISLKGSKIDVLDSAAAVRLGSVVTKGDVNVTADQGSLTLYNAAAPAPVIDTLGDITLIAHTLLKSEAPDFVIVGNHVKLEAESLDFANGSATARAGATLDSGPYKDVDALILNATKGNLVFGVAKAVGGTVTATTPGDLTLGSVVADVANLNAPTGTLSVLTAAVIGKTYNAVFNDYVTGSAALHPTFVTPEPETQTFNIDSHNKAGFAYATAIVGPDLLNIKTAGQLTAGATSAGAAITFDVAALPAAPAGATFNGVVKTTGGAGSTVDILATGAIAEAGAGAILTGSLTAKSVGGMLLEGPNVIPTLKSLVNTGSGATKVNDGASAVTLKALTAAGEVVIAATAGSLDLADPVSTPAATTFSAVTALTGSDLASAGPLTLTSSTTSIAFTGAVSGSSATVKAATDASFNTLTTPGTLDVDTGGAFTANTAQGGSTVLKSGSVDVATLNGGSNTEATVAGQFNVGAFTTGDATITAGTIAVDTATASGSFTATAGDTTFGSLSAGGAVALKTGALAFDSASSGGTFDATSSSIKGGQLAAGGALTLTAVNAITLDTVKATGASTMTGATITETGPFTAGGKAAFKATGALTLATASAGGDLVATAGSFTADTAKAGGSLTATVVGVTKANALEATKGDLLVKTGSFTVVAAQAGQDATFIATGAGKLDTLTAGRDGSLQAASLALVDATAGRNLTTKSGPLTANSLTAKAGDLKVNASTADVKTSAAGGAATLTTTGAATYGDLNTGGNATVLSGGDLGLTTAEVGGDLLIQSLALTSDTLKVVGKADVTATSAGIGTLTAGASVAVDTTGDAVIGQLSSGADSTLTIGGGLTLTAADIGKDLVITAAAFKAETIDAKGNATLTAAGAGQVTTLTAAGDATLTAGSLDIGDATAGANLTTQSGPLTANSLTATAGDLTVTASTADVTTAAHAGGAAKLTTTGAATYGDLTTGGDATVTSGASLGLKTAEIGGDLALKAAGALTVDDAAAAHDLTAQSGPLTAGNLNARAGDLTVTASTADVTTAHAGGAAKLTTTGAATYGDLSTGGNATVISGGDLGLTTAEVGGDLLIQSLALTSDTLKVVGKADVTTTSAGIGTLTSGSDSTLTIGGGLTLATGDVGQDLVVKAGSIDAGVASADRNATFTATGPLTAQSLTAKAGDLRLTAATADVTTAHAGGAATLTTTGAATYGDLSTGGNATVTSGANLGLETAEIGGDLTAKALGLTSDTLTIGGAASLTTTAGDLLVKTLTAGSDATLAAAGELGFTTLSTTTGAVSAKATTVSGGAVTAATTLDLASTGATTLDQAQSGGALTVSASGLTAGGITAGGAAKIVTTAGDATLTTLSAGSDLDLAATGAARVGALASTAPGTRLAITGVDVTLGAATAAAAGAANTLTLNASAPGALTLTASRDATVNLTGPARFAAVTAGRALSGSTRGGDLSIVAAQAGDTLALDSDGSVAVRSTVLGASGRSVAVTAGQDILLGSFAPGAGPSQVVAPAAATLTFRAGRDLAAGLDTGFTANTLAAGRDLNLLARTGDVTLGSAQAGRLLGLTATAGKVSADRVATTGLFAGASGSDATIFGNSLQVTTVDAAGAFRGTAATGDATVASARAGGDLSLTSTRGLASLNSAELTGTVAGVRTLTLTGASATLGRGAAGASAGTLKVATPATTVVLVKATGGAATVDLAGDVRLTRVDATGAATVTTAGALTLADTSGVAGGATVGGDATFGSGGALSAANLQVGGNARLTAASGPLVLSGANALGDVIATAGAGPVTTRGVVGAGRNLTLTATGDAVTIEGTATAGAQALIDASTTADIDTLRAPTVRVLAKDLTLRGGLGQAGATVAVESRSGALTVGGTAAGPGLTLDAAEARRVTADKLDLYAGSTTGTARGDATVADLVIDPAAVKSLSVLAGAGQKVTVSGLVTTTTDGAGAFSVGRAPTDAGVDAWTPQDVTVTGAIGKANAVGTRTFSNVMAVGTVSLNARDDVLIGSTKFIQSIGANVGSNIDITKGVPTGVTIPEDTTPSRIFVAAGTLSLSGGGRIVQESTGIQQAPVGIYLTNPGKASSALKLTGLGVVQPSVIDLSLSFIDGSGTLLSEQIAASSASIGLAGGLNRSNSYRVNGCAIGASQQCTPTTSTVVDVRPSELVQTLVLTQAETPVLADPTITGAGNEEIWRNSPTSLSDDSDDRRAKSTGSPPAPAPAPAAAAAAAPPPEH